MHRAFVHFCMRWGEARLLCRSRAPSRELSEVAEVGFEFASFSVCPDSLRLLVFGLADVITLLDVELPEDSREERHNRRHGRVVVANDFEDPSLINI